MITSKSFLPVEVVFHPSWWHRHYGITFREDFFFDPITRVACERAMRAALYDRLGDLGLGEATALPRPVIGPVNIAAGWLPSGVLGCEIRFFDDASPEVIPANMSDEQITALQPPELETNPLFKKVISMMDVLQKHYGSLEGDVNWEGLQNVALNLRGQQLFVDYYENPILAQHLLEVVAATLRKITTYVRQRTGSTSIAVNRIVGAVDSRISLHPNCSVQMISPMMYHDFLLPHERELARELYPYGVHHCGVDAHKVAKEYAQVEGLEFLDVGWGSDVAACRAALPDAFFSLRLSPIRVATLSPEEVAADAERLLDASGPLSQAALCCINLDDTTPDENVRAIFQVAERYRSYGA
jgi:uroporphyrinogen-III decarboxylase